MKKPGRKPRLNVRAIEATWHLPVSAREVAREYGTTKGSVRAYWSKAKRAGRLPTYNKPKPRQRIHDIAKIEEAWHSVSAREVSRRTGVSQAIVREIWRDAQKEGHLPRCRKPSPRSLAPRPIAPKIVQRHLEHTLERQDNLLSRLCAAA